MSAIQTIFDVDLPSAFLLMLLLSTTLALFTLLDTFTASIAFCCGRLRLVLAFVG